MNQKSATRKLNVGSEYSIVSRNSYSRIIGSQNYLYSSGRDQLTSGANHSLSKNAFSFYVGSISAVSRVRSLILGW